MSISEGRSNRVAGGAKCDAISFDCYGTLIDIAAARGAWLYSFALSCGVENPPPGSQLATRWAEIQLDVVREGGWRPYCQVIETVSARLAAEQQWPWQVSDAEALTVITGAAQPFADVGATLKALQQSDLRLAIVSNTDEAIMEHTLRQLSVPFDAVITAEGCCAFKPSPKPLEQLLDQLAIEPTNLLHVAAGYVYDIPIADALGCATVWINRGNAQRPGPVAPTYEVTNLQSLLEVPAVAGDLVGSTPD